MSKDETTTVEDVLKALRRPLSEYLALQTAAAEKQGWAHAQLPPEQLGRSTQVFEGAKSRTEALVLKGDVVEAYDVVRGAWEASEEIWKETFPPDGACLEQDATRHWFVVVTASLQTYSYKHFGDWDFGRKK